MPVPISPTTPVEGYFPADEPLFTGTPAELNESIAILDVPDASAAGGYVTRGIKMRQLLAAAGNSGAFLTGFYTAPAAGVQTIPVADAVIIADVNIEGPGGSANGQFYGSGYTYANGVLTILAAANVQAGEVIHYSYLTGSVAGGYSDAQARAAQLGRVAPAGTTTVTLDAEAPSDYGTTSGTFTVDATGCVAGKEACFDVDANGAAPQFTNAPTGQPFDLAHAAHQPGKLNRYCVRVLANCIRVLNLAD